MQRFSCDGIEIHGSKVLLSLTPTQPVGCGALVDGIATRIPVPVKLFLERRPPLLGEALQEFPGGTLFDLSRRNKQKTIAKRMEDKSEQTAQIQIAITLSPFLTSSLCSLSSNSG